MRKLGMTLGVAFVLWAPAGSATEASVANSPYPGEVALAQGPNGEWGYKSFPQLLPLYIFKGEPAGKSLCDRDCTAVWRIVMASSKDKPTGLWTVVKRDDGRFQWAYRDSPVYTYFEDRPNTPKGAGKNMDWYLDERGTAYLASVGVTLTPSDADAPKKKPRNIQATSELLKPE